ncbi:MAG TPA: heterodisulfide reductase-related iron-sulfur binding cluster [Gemmatimonadales bacterium]|nr:heterodisulfide reductase-related iron-sulfur binding cluster [Gemmatimonadales bacterium]
MSHSEQLARQMDQALASCVHCGFCLPSCPTYLATSDEADSPRGRIVLMRGLSAGTLTPDDDAVAQHLDACLGCRGCEPVCPSGVEYGKGLEAARAMLAQRRGIPFLARMVLGVFRRKWLWKPIMALMRMLRETGIPARLAGDGRLGFMMGMVASTAPRAAYDGRRSTPSGAHAGAPLPAAMFTGCVMDGLFSHVHDATRRALEHAGYDVREVRGQGCCGALHLHAGDEAGARALARENLRAFRDVAGLIVVNSAGCGAMLKEYAHLVDDATDFSARVRDVSELLQTHLSQLSTLNSQLTAVYDAPCHLQHAQRIHDQPLAMLRSVPGLTLLVPPGSSQCCGSAGIYSLVEPGLSREVLAAKIAELAALEPRPDVVLTGNPGCLMQIGAGLRAAGLPIDVRHPVEVLD